MASGNYEFQSEFARKHQAKGRAEGRAEGEVHGLAHALLSLLEACGLAITSEQRDAISACTDAERLDAWIRRAATAGAAVDVLSVGLCKLFN